MEHILKAVEAIEIAMMSGDPTIIALRQNARLSYAILPQTNPPMPHCGRQAVIRADCGFELLLKAVLRNYSPTTRF